MLSEIRPRYINSYPKKVAAADQSVHDCWQKRLEEARSGLPEATGCSLVSLPVMECLCHSCHVQMPRGVNPNSSHNLPAELSPSVGLTGCAFSGTSCDLVPGVARISGVSQRVRFPITLSNSVSEMRWVSVWLAFPEACVCIHTGIIISALSLRWSEPPCRVTPQEEKTR